VILAGALPAANPSVTQALRTGAGLTTRRRRVKTKIATAQLTRALLDMAARGQRTHRSDPSTHGVGRTNCCRFWRTSSATGKIAYRGR
jgi:hypothetical protein